VIERTDFGDVVRLRLWSWRSRAVGYDSSAYVVRDTLIDTGPHHTRQNLKRFLSEYRVRGVIVTHWHEDHAGNAAMVARTGLPMWLDQYTEHRLRDFPRVKFYRHFTWGRPSNLTGDITRFDPAPLEVIAMPGHSQDHHVVWDAQTRTLFSADLWLGVKVRAVAVTERPRQIVASLARAIALKPERMFDAHRGFVDKPIVALQAKRAWMEAIIGAVEHALDSNQSEDQILKEVLEGEESIGYLSEGEYARRNFIRAVVAERGAISSSGTR
jgi:ribonuclease/clavin/mitogillin